MGADGPREGKTQMSRLANRGTLLGGQATPTTNFGLTRWSMIAYSSQSPVQSSDGVLCISCLCQMIDSGKYCVQAALGTYCS